MRALEKSPAPRLRLRRQFSWTLPANAIYGACNLLLLVVLNKLGSAALAGEFSLALAITAPIFMFANLRFSTLLASDMRASLPVTNYFNLRMKLLAVAMLIVGIYVLLPNPPQFRWLIVVVACAKVAESLSDLCCGVHQRMQRMDRVAKSMMSHGLAIMLAFTAVFAVTRQLYLAAYAMLIARLFVLVCYDIPITRRFVRLPSKWPPSASNGRSSSAWSLLATAAPLGVTALFVSLAANLPRYVIADALSEFDLGLFCSVAVVLQAGNLVFRAIEQPIVPRLAKLIHDGEGLQFWRLLRQLSLGFLGLGIVSCVVSLLYGGQLLSWLYTPEYQTLAGVLAAMTLATVVAQIAGIIESSLIAARITLAQVPLHAVTAGGCLALSMWLIPGFGLYGAVLAIAICRLPFILVGVWLLRQKLSEQSSDSSRAVSERAAA